MAADMEPENRNNSIFENGAIWLRAEFHLHTIRDKEFKFDRSSNDFFNYYIERLKIEKINIGIITNHNKFDKDEYCNLRKKASKENIWIIPGVELSVNDGANGVHCLIVFDNEQWMTNGEDYINQFLTSAFEGIANKENENNRCKYSLTETLDKLSYHKINGRNSFMIMAHVDQESGFFKELNGGRIKELAENENFRNFVLGFQKLRTYEKLSVYTDWFNGKLPALVEGSDCKNIEGVGKAHEQKGIEKKTFVKIGAYNFDALIYALRDSENRLSEDFPKIENAYLKSITFTTTKWKNKKISFNAGMNNFIGIRGSGKSTLLETVRYALDIPIGNNSHEPKYKERLVQNFLGSGGKMEVEMIDKNGKTYISERIYGESPTLFELTKSGERELQYSLKSSAIINKPLYYGQKDLSDIGGETSTEDLISKLMGEKLNSINQEIDEQSSKIINLIADIRKVDKQLAQKEEIEARKAAIEKDMKIFKELEIDKKLNKQIEFNKDINRFDNLLEFENTLIEEIENIYKEYANSFASHTSYESKENPELFNQVYESLARFQKAFQMLADILIQIKTEKGNLQDFKKSLSEKYEALKEEFSELKRNINLPNIEADTYVKLSKDFDFQIAKLNEIKKLDARKVTLRKSLIQALTQLRSLWHQEFSIIQEEIVKLNNDQTAIQIEIEFKGNKDKFKEYLKGYVKGSGLRDALIGEIADTYPDLIEIYNDFGVDGSSINNLCSGGNNLQNFKSKFAENINEFLTYRVPDKFTIFYKGRRLDEHSLGQRASALIIFILTLKENDLIIIDQPEDDLDNQTIYLDVISELKKLKGQTQFIFATHNPNIPVLGDCEQLISCTFNDNLIETKAGSIDNKEIQQNIVDIMEGGDEAFKQRKMIYELWKH
ncbi:MAG: TrlF family AAA-like ATPase [Ginsengibacter sp.]